MASRDPRGRSAGGGAVPDADGLKATGEALGGVTDQLGKLGKARDSFFATGGAPGAPLGLPGLSPGATKASAAAFGLLGKSAKDAFGLIHPAASAVKEAVGAVAGVTREVFNEFTALTSRLSTTSAQFGVSTQAMQGFEGAFRPAGVGAESLASSMGTLQQRMYSTTTENVESIKAFNRLGVSITKVGGGFKPVTQVMDEGIAKLIAIKDPTIRAGVAMNTLGDAALQAANYWRDNGGIAGLNAYRKSIEGFGVVLEQDVTAAAAFRLESGRLNLVLQDFKNDVAGPLHAAAADVSKDLWNWVKAMGPAGTASKPLRESMAGIVSLKGPFADLLKGGGELAVNGLPLMIDGFKALASVGLTLANGVRDGLTYAFEKLGVVGVGVGAALLLAFAPAATIFGGLLLVMEDFISYAKGGPSLIGDSVKSYKKWEADFFKVDGEEPYWLRFTKEFLGILKEIPAFIDKLTDKIANNAFRPVFQLLDRASAEVEASLGVNKNTKRYKETQATREADGALPNSNGTIDAIGRILGLQDGKRKHFGAAIVEGGAGYSEGPPPISPRSPAALQSIGPSPVPSVPGLSSPQSRAPITLAPVVNVNIAGQVLDSKDLVKRIKPELEELYSEQTLSLLQSAAP